MLTNSSRDSRVDSTRLIVQQVTAMALCRQRSRTLERNAWTATYTLTRYICKALCRKTQCDRTQKHYNSSPLKC